MNVVFSNRDFIVTPIGGTTHVELNTLPTAAEVAQVCPFDGVMQVGGEDQLQFRFTSLGVVTGYGLPDNMIEDGEPLILDVENGDYIKLKLEADDFNHITLVEFIVENTKSDPIGVTENHAPTEFQIDLFAIVNGQALKLIGCGDLTVFPVMVLQTSKPEPQCAEEPFIRHYTWQFTTSIQYG